MALPSTIDATYADDVADATVKTHQQHHDVLHAFFNSFEGTTPATFQGAHANLSALSALVGVADRAIYFTAAGTMALATFTGMGRSLVAAADAAAIRAISLAQLGHANLTAFSGLSLIADRLPYASGTGALALTPFTAFARTLLANTDAAGARGTLGAEQSGAYRPSGTDVAVADGGTGASTAASARANLGVEETAYFASEGTLTVKNGKGRMPFPVDAVILGISAMVDTAPTGATIVLDINKNGTTIFTTQSNRPQIVAGANNTATEVTNMNVTAISAGQYLTADIDQIGTTVAGADLTVAVRYRRT